MEKVVKSFNFIYCGERILIHVVLDENGNIVGIGGYPNISNCPTDLYNILLKLVNDWFVEKAKELLNE